MMPAMGRAQIQNADPFGAYPADSHQQQLYQSAGAPVQGLRVQLTNPAGFNLLQAIPQGAARLIPGSAISQKYVEQLLRKITHFSELTSLDLPKHPMNFRLNAH
jgi:hypothetical protein